MPFLAALLLLLAGAATAEARTVVEDDARGGTRAALVYERSNDRLNPSFRDFALRIYDGDELVLERDLATCGGCRRYSPAGFGRTRSVKVRDLDGGEPEVLVDFYTGGAYCCWLTLVYRARGDTYARTAKNWGPKRPRLANFGGGNPEFLSHDDSFLEPYGCNFCWRHLPHVWRFDDGRLRDVTRRFPGQVQPGSKKLRRKYVRASAGDGDVKPVLAAYVATRYLLGRPRAGWRLVRRALRRGELDNRRGRYDFCPCGDRYPRRLRRFLREAGYR
jgi:hypothetical protein